MSTVPRHHQEYRRLSKGFEARRAETEFDDGILSDSYAKLLEADGDVDVVHEVMDELFLGLREQRLQRNTTDWASVVEKCRRHPLCALTHQDPFTSRAYSKPRGYPGDAILMDYIYGIDELWPRPQATPLGSNIFDFTTRAPASEGVRARRGFIADLIDNMSTEHRGMRVLAVAAGHLREACMSSAVRRRRLERFVALDADAASLDEVTQCYGRFGIETTLARVGRLIDSRMDFGQFDLIYSLGLFDYLAQRLGQRIVTRLFDMLRSGGRLLLANFLPGIRDVGYMEAFMDWNLIYRTRQEMLDLTDEIPQKKIKHIQLFAEENQNIIFVIVTKV